jgi:hypothetical protein
MSVWLEKPGLEGFAEALSRLPNGAAVIKDYVKSEKHYWSEAAFVPDVRDLEAAETVAARFIELRGSEMVGGLVVRAFERYMEDELRTWWIDGQHVLTTTHPDTPDSGTFRVETGHLTAAVGSLDCPFVTVDLALREDGVWRVIEVGDGQVSDRPVTSDPAALLRALAA